MNYKFRNEYFAAYGLNKYRNFLSAPDCDCGCGGKGNLVLKTREELFGFFNTMLSENDCDQCAIFAYGFDGQLYAGLKYVTWDEENNTEKVEMTVLSTDEENLEFFQEVDAEFGLHCYGLIIETKNGEWKIIEV
jgi:hypothetical protein